MSRRFNKFGLRRDLSFSDLTNPTQSLNNLLNGLVDLDGESFISQDLDAIKDISATTMVNADFRKIAGAALRVTGTDGQLAVYQPIVKFKNRLDVAKFTTGEPSFFGGDGLTNRYYPSTQLNSTATSADNIFTGDPITLYTDPITSAQTKTEVFWERGIFEFVSKINSQLPDVYGGVSWTGYFKPNVSGKWGFQISTTGFYTFEIDDGAGNYTLIGRKSQKNTSIVVNAAVANATTLTLVTPANIANILAGDVIISSTITQFADTSTTNYAGAVTVSSVDYASGIITLSAALTDAMAANTTLTFRHRIGEISGSFNYISANLEQYRPYKIRYRFWIPNTPADVSVRALKQIAFIVVPPGSASAYLNYKWLYNESYNLDPNENTTSYGDFRKYYNKKIDGGGGIVGGSTYSTYQSILTKAPFNVSYAPPAVIADITAQTKSVNLTANVNSVEMSLTDGIAVGQYVFGTAGITPGTRVKSVSVNQGIFLTANATTTTASTLTFIDHRGLITYDLTGQTTANTKTITVSIATYNAVNVGDIIVASNINASYTTVTRKGTTGTLYLSDAPTTSATSVPMYFYQPKGIINNTLATFCNNVVSAPTVAASSSGSTTLTLAYVDGITVNSVVQFGSRIASGTYVTAVNTTTKVVTLSQGITNGSIDERQLITFAPAGTTENKELCFPPIDTSPPFTATSLGLTTTSDRPSVNIAPSSEATGELKFVSLSADGVTTPALVTLTGTPIIYPEYTRTLIIKDATGASYKILATT